MKINEDYRVKLKMLNIIKDSFGAFVKKEIHYKKEKRYKKIPCFNLETGEEYEVNMGQYLLSLDHSIRLMEREVMKLKQKSVWIKTLKSLFPW